MIGRAGTGEGYFITSDISGNISRDVTGLSPMISLTALLAALALALAPSLAVIATRVEDAMLLRAHVRSVAIVQANRALMSVLACR